MTAACRLRGAAFHDRARRLFAGGLALVAAAVLTGCEERVIAALEVASVEVSPASITLLEGEQVSASAIVKEGGGRELSGRVVTWSVDDPSIATVNSAGLVEGRAAGNTLVHATSEGVTGSAEVSVLPGPAIALSGTSLSLEGVAGDRAPVEAEIDVANGGGGSLHGLLVSVRGSGGSPVPWLEAQLLGSTAPTRIRIRASAENLDAGSHEATVRVESPVARNSPVDAIVRFTVEEQSPPPPPPPPPGSDSCAASNRTFDGKVKIARDASCTFTNVRIRGDLELERGSVLTATNLTVEGNLKARRAEALIVTASRIEGDVEFERGGRADIRMTVIDGNLELESNDGRLNAEGNTIDGNLEAVKNRGGPFTFSGNRIGGNLQCKDNDPAPTGSANIVGGNKEDQCRSL